MKQALLPVLAWLVTLQMGSADVAAQREKATQLFDQGNFNEALSILREILADGSNSSEPWAKDLGRAVQCLRQLGGTGFDALVEGAIKSHGSDWHLLIAAARNYAAAAHYGAIVGGEFKRTEQSGRMVDSRHRDHARALQLIEKALQASANEPAEKRARFFIDAAHIVRGEDAFKLQSLTSLESLPRYDELAGGVGEMRLAPVDSSGSPVYHAAPVSRRSISRPKPQGEPNSSWETR